VEFIKAGQTLAGGTRYPWQRVGKTKKKIEKKFEKGLESNKELRK